MLKLEGHSDEDIDYRDGEEEKKEAEEEDDDEESKDGVVNVRGTAKVVFFGRN